MATLNCLPARLPTVFAVPVRVFARSRQRAALLWLLAWTCAAAPLAHALQAPQIWVAVPYCSALAAPGSGSAPHGAPAHAQVVLHFALAAGAAPLGAPSIPRMAVQAQAPTPTVQARRADAALPIAPWIRPRPRAPPPATDRA